VLVHDFPQDAVGKAIPNGVYDVSRNEGWVSVGADHDTAALAVATIRAWWRTMGKRATRTLANCTSSPMPEAATAIAAVSGTLSSRSSPTTRV
jgi:hypothetical protein